MRGLMRNYSATPATRALTPTGGFLGGFGYSLNPYVGCAFGDRGGCPFCYVRALPVARARPGPWGSWVIAKSNLLELLARELRGLEESGSLSARPSSCRARPIRTRGSSGGCALRAGLWNCSYVTRR